MPIGILGSLASEVLYMLFAHVLTGIAPVDFFDRRERGSSVARASTPSCRALRLSNAVTVAILGGFSSGDPRHALGQSRVFYTMSRDGLVPRRSRTSTPGTHALQVALALLRLHRLFAAFVPEDSSAT